MKDFNYCPKCGGKSLQGNPRRIECSACGFVFYLNTAAAVAAIIQKDNTILLTTRAKEPEKGKLDLPGGFVDHNESAQEALQREIREELNIEITDMQYFGGFPNQYLYKEITYPVLDSVFTCRAVSWQNAKAQDDVADFDFYPRDRINISDLGFPSVRRVMQKFLQV
jgi:ADP-ribose pyrophosphatase YjhB (NUDIX family)